MTAGREATCPNGGGDHHWHGPYDDLGGREQCCQCGEQRDQSGRKATMTPEEKDGVVSVALHPALFDAFVSWLDSRGCDLSPPIPTGEGDTFRVVSPRLSPPARGATG